MAINMHRRDEHALPTERQWMLHPVHICSHPVIARCHPVKHPAGAASRPAAAALQATVAPAPPHSAAVVAALQLASSSALGSSFVVAPAVRVATLGAPPARTSSRPVAAVFQAEMVAPAHSVAGLMSPAINPAYPCSVVAPVGGGRGGRTRRWKRR